MENDDRARILLNLTTEIVATYAENNSIPVADLPGLIMSVHQSLAGIENPATEPAAASPQPAISARKSLSNPNHIISMIDGKPYAMLTRHIKLAGYTPQSYRQAFGLPADYPMVATAYSAKRRELAKAIGLGHKKTAEPASPPAKATVRANAAPQSRPRSLKAAIGKARNHLGSK